MLTKLMLRLSPVKLAADGFSFVKRPLLMSLVLEMEGKLK